MNVAQQVDLTRAAVLHASAPFVCRLRTQDGSVVFGNGFLVAPRLVLTNWHVWNKISVAGQGGVVCEFGNARDGQESIRLAKNPCLDSSPPSPQEILGRRHGAGSGLDFALLKLARTRRGRCGYMRVFHPRVAPEGSPAAVLGDVRVFLIQWPPARDGSEPQQPYCTDGVVLMSEGDSERSSRVANRMQYTATSTAGVSGAPVLNDENQVIALHHGKAGQASQGIPIWLIVARPAVRVAVGREKLLCCIARGLPVAIALLFAIFVAMWVYFRSVDSSGDDGLPPVAASASVAEGSDAALLKPDGGVELDPAPHEPTDHGSGSPEHSPPGTATETGVLSDPVCESLGSDDLRDLFHMMRRLVDQDSGQAGIVRHLRSACDRAEDGDGFMPIYGSESPQDLRPTVTDEIDQMLSLVESQEHELDKWSNYGCTALVLQLRGVNATRRRVLLAVKRPTRAPSREDVCGWSEDYSEAHGTTGQLLNRYHALLRSR